jgi:hypothetical protein
MLAPVCNPSYPGGRDLEDIVPKTLSWKDLSQNGWRSGSSQGATEKQVCSPKFKTQCQPPKKEVTTVGEGDYRCGSSERVPAKKAANTGLKYSSWVVYTTPQPKQFSIHSQFKTWVSQNLWHQIKIFLKRVMKQKSHLQIVSMIVNPDTNIQRTLKRKKK